MKPEHPLSRSLLVLTVSLLASACGQEPANTAEKQPPSVSTSKDTAPSTTLAATSEHIFKPNTATMPGRPIWEQNCKVCHGTGLAGAPVIGHTTSWQKRLQRGKEDLYQHALNGWGDMPARGGNPNLTDEQVTQAVDFMIAQVDS